MGVAGMAVAVLITCISTPHHCKMGLSVLHHKQHHHQHLQLQEQQSSHYSLLPNSPPTADTGRVCHHGSKTLDIHDANSRHLPIQDCQSQTLFFGSSRTRSEVSNISDQFTLQRSCKKKIIFSCFKYSGSGLFVKPRVTYNHSARLKLQRQSTSRKGLVFTNKFCVWSKKRPKSLRSSLAPLKSTHVSSLELPKLQFSNQLRSKHRPSSSKYSHISNISQKCFAQHLPDNSEEFCLHCNIKHNNFHRKTEGPIATSLLERSHSPHSLEKVSVF